MQKVNPSKMKSMQRFPQPQSVQVDDPEASAPIFGTFTDSKKHQNEGADYDVECAAWGDNEMHTGVKYAADQAKKQDKGEY